MGLLANLKLRRKLLLVMAPLAVMALIAGVYSSVRSKMIDTWYTVLIDGELDSSYSVYKMLLAEAARLAPAWASRITQLGNEFDKAVLDSRPVRAAALAGDREKAAGLIRSRVDAELQQAGEQLIVAAEELQKAVDKRSDDLTVKTHRSILVTWLVIGLGVLVTFSFAFYVLHTEVVKELLTLRDSIRALASGKLSESIPFLDRPNEIGEISRSLRTLQAGAQDRDRAFPHLRIDSAPLRFLLSRRRFPYASKPCWQLRARGRDGIGRVRARRRLGRPGRQRTPRARSLFC